jgi:threonine dehydrogenase-like Zn-dependent dehydrogenase
MWAPRRGGGAEPLLDDVARRRTDDGWWRDRLRVEDEETVRAAAYGLKPLLQRIERGEIDPTRIITHTLPLDDAERGFEIFKNKQDNCEKVVLKP